MQNPSISNKGKYAKRKGKNFEYWIREKISKYLNIPKESIMRTEKLLSPQPFGDLITVGEYFWKLPIYIEAKKQEIVDLIHFFTSQDNIFVRWWLKVAEQIPDAKLINSLALVFGKNYIPAFIMLTEKKATELIGTDWEIINVYINFYHEKLNRNFIICKFEDFLKERRLVLDVKS